MTITPLAVGAQPSAAPAPAPRDVAASPALRVPGVTVLVDGSPLPGRSAQSLGAVRVRREASSPAACALTFTEPADADALDARLSLGTSVRVGLDAWGDPLFTGEVVAVEHVYGPDGVHRVHVRCHDVAHRLRADSRLRAFVDVTVADVVRELVDGTGLSVDSGDDGPRWPRILQDGRSALDLLTTLTRRSGTWWQVDPAGERLVVFGAEGTDDEVEVARGRELLEASLEVSAVGVHEQWRVVGWDPVSGAVVDETEGAGADLGDGGDAPAVRGGVLAAGPDHASALATALAGEDAARSRSLRAVVAGDPAIGPGTRLTVAGVAAAVAGTYPVLSAEHVVDGIGGYTCTVSSAPPAHLRVRDGGPGTASDRPGTTLGEVLRVDDPDNRGRVRVSLPAYDGLESEWLPVLALGSGEEKGLTVQPDVGDAVLVAHDGTDPGRGVVLGGIRTAAGSEPSAGVSGNEVGAYALRLPGGQSLRLSRDGDTVAVANAKGSSVTLSETGVVVSSVGNLVLEAPGHGLILRAAKIDLERG